MKLTTAQRGAAWMILGVLCMASMDVMAKTLGHRVPVAQIVWLRFVSQAILIGAFLIISGQSLLSSNHFRLHALRGFATTTSSYLFFLAVIYLPLADATALMQVAPVMVALGAVLVLKERIGKRRVFGIIAAFIGAMILIRPGTSVMTTMSLVPLIGAVFFAIYALATRFVRDDGPWKALFYQGFFGACFASLIVPFFWQPIAHNDIPILITLILLGIIGHLFIIRAFATAQASDIAPFGYAGLLFAISFGVIIFGEIPDILTLLGAIVIVSAGLYVWYRERLTEADPEND